MPKKPEPAEFAQAINVSAAFDNCFFHSYALHLFANELAFPADLFTFKSIAGEQSPASQLQKYFPDLNSLSLFEEYTKITRPNTKPISPNFIMEKTMVIGILLREWFATKIAGQEKLQDDLQRFMVAAFDGYKTAKIAGTQDADLLNDIPGASYSANKAFLDYFTARSKKEGELTPEEKLMLGEKLFEQYFTEAKGKEEDALIAYWKKEGFPLYCKQIASPGTKLSYEDVNRVMKFVLQQPLAVYSASNAPATYNYDGEENAHTPEMQVLIDGNAGHYKLLRPGKNENLLNEYVASNEQYKKDRERALTEATPQEKTKSARAASSLLVEAIFPPNQFGKEPYQLLLERVGDLKEKIHQYEQERAKKLLGQLNQEQQGLIEKEIAPLRQAFVDKVKEFEQKLSVFPIGSKEFKAITDLRDNLIKEGRKYFNKLDQETYRTFQNNCKEHLQKASSILSHHRGWAKLTASILVVVASFGLALGLDLALHKGRLTLFATDSAIKIGELEDRINDLTPTPKPGGG